VLGGRAMQIVHTPSEFERYVQEHPHLAGAADILIRYPNDKTGQINSVLSDNPLLFDGYLSRAIEIDVDCLSDGKDVFVCGIMEHIEEAGIHSGDSACSLPPQHLSDEVIAELKRQTTELALALKVGGLMNVQYALKDGTIYILEVNPRASRTVPFVAKVIGEPIAKIASRIMAGESLASFNLDRKAAQPHRRQGSRLPVQPLPRRRHRARPRDEVDRRGHRPRHRLRHGLRQVAARRRQQGAARRHRVRLGPRRRQAADPGVLPPPRTCRLQDRRYLRHPQVPRRERHRATKVNKVLEGRMTCH
jgi:hypothetical protein